jgi:hypothetical protein
MLVNWSKYIQSKWIIILIAGAIGSVYGLISVYSKKPLYTAELTFVLEGGKQKNMGNYAILANQLGFGGGGSASSGIFEGENLFGLMLSRSMIQKALLTTVDVKGKKQTLAEFYITMNNLRDKWAKNSPKLLNVKFLPRVKSSDFSLQQTSLITSFHLSLIKENLSVGIDKKSGFMFIKVVSEDEIFSKYFVEVLAQEVSDFYIETKIKKSLHNVAVLQQKADSVRREFNLAIAGVASSIDANPNANPARNRLAVSSKVRQVDAEANQAMLVELMKNLTISQMTLREETPLIQVIDRPVLPLPVQVFSKLRELISWGIIGGIIAIFLLSIKKIIKGVMTSEQ